MTTSLVNAVPAWLAWDNHTWAATTGTISWVFVMIPLALGRYVNASFSTQRYGRIVMSKYFVLSTLCVLSFVLPISGAKGDEAAHSRLEALGFLIGEWDGAYEMPAAVPEIGAVKGSKTTQHLSTEWILDGAAIEMRISTVVDGKKQPPSKELIVGTQRRRRLLT